MFRIITLSIFMVLAGLHAKADEGPVLVVSAERGELRVNQNGETKIIATLPRGHRLYALEEQSGYYRVTDPRSGKWAWIWKNQVKEAFFSEEAVEQYSTVGKDWGRADDLRDEGQYEQAEKIYRRLLSRLETHFGKEFPDVPRLYQRIGLSYYLRGDLDQALPLYKESLQLYGRSFGNRHSETIAVLNDVGFIYEEKENYSAAIKQFEEVLNSRLLTSKVSDEDLAISYHNVARNHRRLDHFPEAERLYVKALAAIRRAEKSNTKEAISIMDELALLYRDTGRNAKAIELLQQAHSICNENFGQHDQGTLATLGNLAETYLENGDLILAESICEQVYASRKQEFGTANTETAYASCVLATAQFKLGDFRRAEAHALTAFSTFEKDYGESHTRTLMALELLGAIYHAEANYPKAAASFETVLAGRKKILGANHTLTAQSHNNVAAAHIENGTDSAAVPHLEQAQDIYERRLGKESAQLCSVLNNLAEISMRKKDYIQAKQLLERSLKISETSLGRSHLDTVGCRVSLSRIHLKQNELSTAEMQLKQALEGLTGTYKSGHPEMGRVHELLGNLYFQRNDYKAAESHYVEAHENWERFLGKSHPGTARVLAALTHVHIREGSLGSAIRTQDQAMESFHDHLRTILPTMNDAARASYLGLDFRKTYDMSLAFGKLHANDRRATMVSADWLLNFKAAPQEAIAEAALLSSPELADTVRDLKGVRSRLSQLTLTPPDEVTEEVKTQLAALETKQQEFQQKISAARTTTSSGSRWLSSGELMGRIPFGAVFINIARFRERDFDVDNEEDTHAWKPDIYAAWLIPSAGEGAVRIVSLGPAVTIDEQIKRVRQLFSPEQLTRIQKNGEEATANEFREQAAALSESIFHPLEAYLQDAQELIISPDSELWTIPWDALPTSSGKFVIEEYQTRYVLSGRELISEPKQRELIGEPIVFADPDYDLDVDRLTATETKDTHQLRSASSAYFPRLANSAAEAAAIKPSIDEWTGATSRIALQGDAKEAIFKSLHRPRLIVLSTHGYFEPSPDQNGQGAEVSSNPLLRCGLALAGCNNRKLATAQGKEDGILTGLEIIGTDLRGTELVVLSACETGLGDVRTGEGVAGLRQAFQLAGAESVVSSLWQVEDGETARLMKLFFENLASGMNKPEALRQAQLTRIKARRERTGAAHPFFWAAFTLTGQE